MLRDRFRKVARQVQEAFPCATGPRVPEGRREETMEAVDSGALGAGRTDQICKAGDIERKLREAVDAIDRQKWLDQMAEPLQKWVTNSYASAGPAGQRIKNYLHGTWLGHPLHPAITDVPIGAWAAAFTLDTLESLNGDKKLAAAADAVVAIGIVGAIGSAATGLTDWQHVDGRARRIGLTHALLNASATVLYLFSLLLRIGGARGAGKGLAFLGFTAANAAAFLGGDLVYDEQIGVNRASKQAPPPEFKPVLPETELPEGKPRQVQIEGAPILLVRQGEQVYAIGDTCSHLGCSLSWGHVQDNSIICSCHGSRFSLGDGRVLDGPATFPEPRFEARIREGQIEVRGIAG